MELQDNQKKMINELKGLKHHLVKTNAPLSFIDLINDCVDIISMPIPFMPLTQEDFTPSEYSNKTNSKIEINNSTIVITDKQLNTDLIEQLLSPPLDDENI